MKDVISIQRVCNCNNAGDSVISFEHFEKYLVMNLWIDHSLCFLVQVNVVKKCAGDFCQHCLYIMLI